jgi:hypothetical protein
MEQSKLPHSIAGALISWFLTILIWCGTHIGLLCGILAGIASIYSIRASRETIDFRRKQKRALTQLNEPETDL